MYARPVLAALALALPCPAQRTWIVDQAGQPGFDFLDLPAALTAARDGDTIVVRAGTYRAGSTSKELTLLGEPGARLGGPFPVTLGISLIGAGRTFVLKGFEIDYSAAAIRPIDIDGRGHGRVHLEDLTVRAAPTPVTQADNPAISVGGVALVTVSHCVGVGSPWLRLQQCGAAAVTRCDATGSDAVAGGRRSQPGIAVDSTTAVLSMCVARGGNGVVSSFADPAAPGLVANGARLTVAGDATSSFVAGNLGLQPVSAISGSGNSSTLRIDPAVQLGSLLGAPPLANFSSIRVARLPAVTAIQTTAVLQTDFYAPAGDGLVLLFSAPDHPYALPPLGDLWIDPTQVFLAIGTVQGPGEHWQLQFPVDAHVPRGLALGLQGLSGPSINTMELSTPSVIVLR